MPTRGRWRIVIDQYLKTWNPSDDPTTRIAYLREGVAAGGTDAAEYLAYLLWNGDGVTQDRKEAVRILTQSALARTWGYNDFVAQLHFRGVIVERDLGIAERLLRKSIETSRGRVFGVLSADSKEQALNKVENGEVFYSIAREMENRSQLSKTIWFSRQWAPTKEWVLTVDAPADPEGALLVYRLAAERGDKEAQDTVRAFWYRRAVMKADPVVLRDEFDPALAEAFVLRAAATGEPEARQHIIDIYRALASYYFGGKGVPKSALESFRWQLKAAEIGDPDAQYMVSRAYERGEGVPKDMVQAYKWLNLAAAGDRDSYYLQRDILEEKLSPQQVAQGQELSRSWIRKDLPGQKLRSAIPHQKASPAALQPEQPRPDPAGSAIERIRASRYAPMPDPRVAIGGSGTALRVENRTKLIINIYLAGASSHTLEVPPSATLSVNLRPGRYRVAAEITNSPITPFYGEQTFNADTQYQQVFYLSESSEASGKKN